jgi:hypothetical protein
MALVGSQKTSRGIFLEKNCLRRLSQNITNGYDVMLCTNGFTPVRRTFLSLISLNIVKYMCRIVILYGSFGEMPGKTVPRERNGTSI